MRPEVTDEMRRLARWFNLHPDYEQDWPLEMFVDLLKMKPYLEKRVWFALLHGILMNWDAAITPARIAVCLSPQVTEHD